MEVYSDQPGVQFYTANFLPDPSSADKLTAGKKGAYYMKHGAFCLETQNFPDAVNHVSYSLSLLTGEIIITSSFTTLFFFTDRYVIKSFTLFSYVSLFQMELIIMLT